MRLGDFECLAAGPEDGELVLCLHGFPDHAPSFAELLDRLAAAGFRAVAPWLRGYAPSTLAGPFHLGQLADDVLTMAGGRRFSLVGHDWGAVITYRVCERAPERVRRAVTLSVPPPWTFVRNLGLRQLAKSWYMLFFQIPRLPERVIVRDDFAFIDRLWRVWSPGLAADLSELKRCLAASMPAPIEYYRALRPARGRPIATPTLYLHGAEDGCIGPEVGDGSNRWFTGEFVREVIPGVGHFLHLEDDRVLDRVVDWMKRPD